MSDVVCNKTVEEKETTLILDEIDIEYEENLIGENISNCDNYGCTCISHEKCCGCFIQ